MEVKRNITYEHVSGGSPVIMKERVNGFIVAEYLAFIDRGGYNWTLYPRKKYFVWNSVPFEKKKVPVRLVTVLPNPNLKLPKPSYETEEKAPSSEPINLL